MSEQKLSISNRYQKVNVSDALIDQWIACGVNAMLIGARGTGKTQRVKEGFERNFKKFGFYSGATMDPHTDLIGVPRVAISDKSQQEVLKYVRPEEIDEDIEAFFVDEFNRSKDAVKNALMELIQFKTINGKKFPNLKVVWAAINPPPSEEDDEEDHYLVGHIDPAQLDRFHIIVRVPDEPCQKFFNKKYGKEMGASLVGWWKKLPIDAKKHVSPRRLDYVGDMFKMGLDIKYALPQNCLVDDLIRALEYSPTDLDLFAFKKNPSQSALKKLIDGDAKVWERYRDEILDNDNNYSLIAGAIPSECFATEILDEKFKMHQCAFYISGFKDSRKEIDKILKANPKHTLKKTIAALDFLFDGRKNRIFEAHANSSWTICYDSSMSIKDYINDVNPLFKEVLAGNPVPNLNPVSYQAMLKDLSEGSWDFSSEEERLIVSRMLRDIVTGGKHQNMFKNISIIYNSIGAFSEQGETETIDNLEKIHKACAKYVDITLFTPIERFKIKDMRLSRDFVDNWIKCISKK